MNREQFDALVKDTIAVTATLLIKKGAEYADGDDRLANFKRNAEKQTTTSLQIWKQYIGKHIDSLDSYFKRVHSTAFNIALLRVIEDVDAVRPPTQEEFEHELIRALPEAMRTVDENLSEPIEGRFHDVINYCFLGLALIKDVRDAKETS